MMTAHSITRAHECLGIKRKSAEHLIRNGLTRGKTLFDYGLRREQDWLAKRGRFYCTAYAYNGCCLIADDTSNCVTLYALPVWFNRRPLHDGKKVIRNVQKYERMNNRCYQEEV